MRFSDEEIDTKDRDDAAEDHRSPADDEGKTMSLLGGVARPEGLADADEFDADALSGPKAGGGLFGQGTLLIAVLVVVGIGSLYVMRMSQGDLGDSSVAKEVEAKIEQALAKLTRPGSLSPDDPLREENLSALFQNTETVLAMFANDPVKRQVPLEFVKKDPFDLVIEREKGHETIPTRNTADDDAQRLRQKLALELNSLRLQSIIQGARPTAIISNEIVVPGQRVGSFKVKAIDAFSVTLSVGDDLFVLKMDMQAGGRR